jgi:hypothetical protein
MTAQPRKYRDREPGPADSPRRTCQHLQQFPGIAS